MPGPGPGARPCSSWLPPALRGGLPLSAPSRPVTQSSRWIVAAIANPSVVTTPVSLPPCWWASGIIVSASMVRIAPAAKARTKATVPGEECWNRPYPASEARPGDHGDRDPHPQDPRLLPAAGPQAGGGGDRFGQVGDQHRGQVGGAHRAALEDRQADHHRLGDPSSTVPSTMASAEPFAWPPSASLRSAPPKWSISRSPPKKTAQPANRPATAAP